LVNKAAHLLALAHLYQLSSDDVGVPCLRLANTSTSVAATSVWIVGAHLVRRAVMWAKQLDVYADDEAESLIYNQTRACRSQLLYFSAGSWC
jgi:hypothetical protein